MAQPWWKSSWSVPAAMRAARAMVVPGLFAITYKVIADPQMALFATFGAIATVIIAGFGGTRRDKFAAHTGLAVAGSLALIIGTLVSGTTWLAAVVTVPVTFAIFFAGIGGPNAASGSTAAMFAYVLPVASAGGAATIPSRLEGWWLASAAGTIAVLLLAPPAPANRLRATAAELAGELAGRLRAAATGQVTGPEAMTAAKERLSAAFTAAPYRPTGLATADQALSSLVQLLEWGAAQAGDAFDGHLDLAQACPADRTLLRAAADLFADTRSLLLGATADPDFDALETARAVSAARLRELSGRDGEPDARLAAAHAVHAQAIAVVARSAAADALIASRHASAETIAAERRDWYGTPAVAAVAAVAAAVPAARTAARTAPDLAGDRAGGEGGSAASVLSEAANATTTAAGPLIGNGSGRVPTGDGTGTATGPAGPAGPAEADTTTGHGGSASSGRSPWAAGLGGSGGAAGPAGGEGLLGALAASPRLAGLAGAATLLRRHATVRSVWFLNSLRGALALAAAVAIADVSGVQHGFWVVLGTLSVLRTSASATGSTALRALAGTVVGFVVGAALLVGIGTTPDALWAVLPVAVFVAGYAPGTTPFLVGQAAFTVTVVVFFNLLAPVGWTVGLLRIEDVAIGCAVSLAVGVLFWPRGVSTVVADDLADAFRSGAAYLTQSVDWALSELMVPPAAAIAANGAGLRLDDAVRGFLTEQGSKRVSKEDLWALVNASTRLRLTAHTLAALRPAAPVPDANSSGGPASGPDMGSACLPLAGSEEYAGAPACIGLRSTAAGLAGFYGAIALEVSHPRADELAPIPPPAVTGPAVPRQRSAAEAGNGAAPVDATSPTHQLPHPHLLWVQEHLHHLSASAQTVSEPALRMAEIRRRPWWR